LNRFPTCAKSVELDCFWGYKYF